MAMAAAGPPGRPPFGSLVSFLFGAGQRETLPGKALVVLAGEYGVPEPSVRSGLARLIRQGSLVSARRGRAADYTLTGPMLASFRRARSAAEQGSAGPTTEPWGGGFHALLYTVPEQERSFRDRLRRTARMAGYAPLGAGLMICPRPRWEEIEALVSGAPPLARVSSAELRMDIADARRAATEAWELDTIARRQRLQADQLAEAVDAEGELAPDAGTLRRHIDLTLPVYQAFAHDPHLPAELLPQDWPGPQLAENLGRLRGRYGAAAREHVTAAIEAAG